MNTDIKIEFEKNLEMWKSIPNCTYLISSKGNIKNSLGKMLKPSMETCGYFGITLKMNSGRKRYRIHRLVANTFISNHNGLRQVNHKDGDKANNEMSNLEWCTQSYNMLHAVQNGLRKVGEKHGRAKLTNEQALEIFNSNLSIKELSQVYKVSPVLIGRIKNGQTWRQVTNASIKKTRLSKEEVIDIFTSHGSVLEMAKEYNVNAETIRLIKKKRTWTHITNDL